MRPMTKVPEAGAKTLQCENDEQDGPLDKTALDNVRAMQRPGAENILNRLIRLYLESSPGILDSLRDALQREEGNAVREAAHGLKSASANMGALKLSVLCKQIEELGHAEKTAEAAALLPDLEAEYQRVVAALRAEQEKLSEQPPAANAAAS